MFAQVDKRDKKKENKRKHQNRIMLIQIISEPQSTIRTQYLF